MRGGREKLGRACACGSMFHGERKRRKDDESDHSKVAIGKLHLCCPSQVMKCNSPPSTFLLGLRKVFYRHFL